MANVPTRASNLLKSGRIVQVERIKPTCPQPISVIDADICPVCKGIGWLRLDVPHGHPQFGRPVKCQCEAVKSARRAIVRTYTWLGVGEREARELENLTFANFQPNANGKDIAQAYRQARGYADRLKEQVEGQKSALLVGPYGVGKTHLACAILNAVRARGDLSCLFISGDQFFQALYKSHFDEQIIQQAIDAPLLCFDDLDKMQIRDDGSYQKTTLFNLFNQRYLACRPVIITANEADDWQQWLHGAILSRLLGNAEAIVMNGQDFRMMTR